MPQAELTRTPEQLDAILREGSGSLLETPYPILLLALSLRQKSAVLLLHRNQLQKEIVFDDGAPVDCQSNIATETLSRFLVSSGKLSELDAHTAQSLATAQGVSFEEILTERKMLPATELYRVLQQSLGRKLLEPFSWKSGTYEISYDVPPDESALRVKVPQLLFTGILKVETQESVDEAVAFAREKYLGLASDPLVDLEEIRLTAEQQKVIDAAQAGTRLSGVAAASGVDEDDVNRIVYALLILGAVSVSDTPVRIAPSFELDHPFLKHTTEAPLPANLPPLELPPPPKAEPKKTGVEPAAAEEVMSAYLAYRRKDALDLLEVAETDGASQFIRGFLRMADKFLPSKFDERAPDGLRDKAQEVFLASARAYAELADPARRDALVNARMKKRELSAPVAETTLIVPAPKAPAPAAVAPRAEPEKAAPTLIQKKSGLGLTKGALIDPELLCRNGRELADAGKLREALSSFEMAAECDAQNGTYAAEVAWSRFRLNVSPAATTLKMLKNAIRIDPRSGLANLYAGKVATILGDRNEASAYLNRAAMLMPRDMRVVEALKALR